MIRLEKNQRIKLTKSSGIVLNQIHLGLGWDVKDGIKCDLDASIVLIDKNGKVKDNNFIFYHNLESSCGSVVHSGDNRTGEGDGDDEILLIDLTKVPEDIAKISCIVSIHDYERFKQNFGIVEKAFVRVVDQSNQEEVARYDLTEDYSLFTALIFCHFERQEDNSWLFVTENTGFRNGLAEVLTSFGLEVE